MYAIVEVGGMQYKVTQAASVLVPRVKQDPGKAIELDRVLLIVEDGKVNIGTPFVKSAVVKATVVSHIKDDKVLVFKKKRRKNYKVLRGHRQQLTEIQIDSINLGQAAAPARPKAEKKTGTPKAQPAAKAAKPVKAAAAKPKTAARPAAAKKAAVKKDSGPKKTEKKAASTRTSGSKTKKSGSKPSAKKEA
jgi:large subunit ribosomal protein L21